MVTVHEMDLRTLRQTTWKNKTLWWRLRFTIHPHKCFRRVGHISRRHHSHSIPRRHHIPHHPLSLSLALSLTNLNSSNRLLPTTLITLNISNPGIRIHNIRYISSMRHLNSLTIFPTTLHIIFKLVQSTPRFLL